MIRLAMVLVGYIVVACGGDGERAANWQLQRLASYTFECGREDLLWSLQAKGRRQMPGVEIFTFS
jgi:hypothetical protein